MIVLEKINNYGKRNGARMAGFLLLVLFLITLADVALLAEKKKKVQSPGAVKVEKTADPADKLKKNEKTGTEGNAEPTVEEKQPLVKEEPGIPGITDKEYTEDDFKPKAEEESYAWMIIKTILILGILVGAFYYFFQFVTKKAGINIQGEDVVRILSVVPVGQNKYIQVVDLAGKILVLGIADSGINLITEITSKEEMDRIRLLGSRSKPVPEGGFQEYIKTQIGRVIEKINDKYEHNTTTDTMLGGDSGVDLDYLKRQKKRLKHLNGNGDE